MALALPPCGGRPATSDLTDTFEGDGALDEQWNLDISHDQMVQRVAGQLQIPALANNGTGSATVKSAVQAYDMRSCYLQLELVSVPDQGTQGFVFAFVYDYASALGWTVEDNMLKLEYQNNGGEDTAVGPEVPYDPLLHRWLRLSEDGGTVTWETSPDGAAWNMAATLSAGFAIDLSHLEVRLQAGTNDSVPNPGEAVFDNVNVTP